MMEMLRNRKLVKTVSLVVAVVFVLGIGAIALSQTQTVNAASKSNAIGFVDYDKLMEAYPDSAKVKDTLKQEYDGLKKQYDEQATKLSAQEQQQLADQYQQKISLKQQELVAEIRSKVDTVIRQVADDQGVAVVLDKSVVFVGGRDLTDDVIKKFSK